MFTLIGIGVTDDYIKYTRQDARLVVWLLAVVVVMLGVIADLIH